MRTFIFWCIIFLGLGCNQVIHSKTADAQKPPPGNFTLYSTQVKDSFLINVYIPDTSAVNAPDRLPVIYVLDANLYFDIYASILKKYSEVGLLPPAILIGVGYNSFHKMDSLRVRDYTFPVGLPEYEMPVSGKADAFLNFLQQELVPMIDRKFSCDTSNRVLVGHSFGGYFAMYALLEELRRDNNIFSGFIAASPSLHYNHNYLLNQFDSVSKRSHRERKVYLAFGGHEDVELKTEMGMSVDHLYSKLRFDLSPISTIKLKTVTFSEMDHMDCQVPAFVKGVQWILSEE